ncbi:DUF1329 domain-containing protein [Deltaproteobacteria bacterium IMCC39524]|nr:DUF1329 domain-containing protein [Deltaproteobacteria bacterium IMCC39524]
MKKTICKLSIFLMAGLLLTSQGFAAVSADEAARLGKDLTPMGGEKAGNADGTIPAWDGGITTPPASYEKGMHHPDPYAADKILFTVTADNMGQYADKLTVGQQAMLEAYPSYKMNVYPTHRSAAMPQRIYDATKAVAVTATLAEGDNGVNGAINGIPFPIPEKGVEVIWNHILRWRGNAFDRNFGLAPMTRGGDFTMVEFNEKGDFRYSHEGMTEEKFNNTIATFKQEIFAPARVAGRILLVHETLDQNKENRRAWLYNPGQRRVRRAPNVAFDNPKEGGDGLTTSDTVDMYNGSPERYNWELVGKKEIYVPYNSYLLHSDKLKYKDILTPLHLNPDYLRYELHRVWVVEATLKEGTSHIYKRRTFYVDEDTWQILAMDQYDSRDQLWRVSEGHCINYYEVPTFWSTVETHYDLQSGRYIAINLNNEHSMYNFDVKFSGKEFTASALRRSGKR